MSGSSIATPSDIWLWCVTEDQPLPTAKGWYPVLVCWDPMEGVFAGPSRWNGKAWDCAAVSAWSPCRFETMLAARDMAYRHDPEV